MPDQDAWGAMRVLVPKWMWLLVNHRRVIAELEHDKRELMNQLGYKSFAQFVNPVCKGLQVSDETKPQQPETPPAPPTPETPDKGAPVQPYDISPPGNPGGGH